MRRSSSWILGLLLLWTVQASAQTSSIRVDASQQGKPISPILWGIFFEEINHAGDGGIYAEMVRNRSFEDAPPAALPSWRLVDNTGKSRIAIDETRPLNPRNPRSLRWEIVEGSTAPHLVNEGYWGISVEKGKRYRLSLYARCDTRFNGTLQVSLQGAGGEVYAQQVIRGIGADWRQFSTTLVSRATDPKARLVITASSPGVVWLDMVSLMPYHTFKGRPNGLRPDLAQMLADLKPSFLRFPGGCFVEGDRMHNALRWRDTLGDIAERPARWCVWGYTTTQGLGLHEYLQMSEDLGAEPMLVVNCGMACQYRNGDVAPMEQLEEWIEDALAAIEYAIGDVNTKWGALRAKNGRTKPFPLRFVEVGNENWGPAYEERYARFYDAIKARFPQIQIIATAPVRSRPMDVLDEHFYSSADWFIAQARRYDSYNRNGPKIFVGEYAVTQGAGQGNLRAALGEAAFMTGIERNSDIVIMAAYAPLFVNVNARQWNPDLIGFDSSRVYGTPSYYVQQLFSLYRGTHVLPTSVESPVRMALRTQGAVGVGTWRTQAEYRDIRVERNGETLLLVDPEQAVNTGRKRRGEWQAVDGNIRQNNLAEDVRLVVGDPQWNDYTLTLRARKLGGAEGFLILFRVRDDDNWYWWNIGGWGNTRHAVERSLGGAKSIVSNEVAGSVETGRWYDIRVEVRGDRIRCYLDGVLVHDFRDVPPSALYAVASRHAQRGELILKVVNVSAEPIETEIHLQGVRNLQPTGKVITLTSDSPEDENSLQNPKKVAPREGTLRGVGSLFRYTFPKHSLTVMVLKER